LSANKNQDVPAALKLCSQMVFLCVVRVTAAMQVEQDFVSGLICMQIQEAGRVQARNNGLTLWLDTFGSSQASSTS
jgi:hypothetical protein